MSVSSSLSVFALPHLDQSVLIMSVGLNRASRSRIRICVHQSSDARRVHAPSMLARWPRSPLSDSALTRQPAHDLHVAADTGSWLNPGPLSLVAPSQWAVIACRGDSHPVDTVCGTPLSGPPSHFVGTNVLLCNTLVPTHPGGSTLAHILQGEVLPIDSAVTAATGSKL